MRCPLCSGRIEVYIKSKVVGCTSCGWMRSTDSRKAKMGKATLLTDFF